MTEWGAFASFIAFGMTSGSLVLAVFYGVKFLARRKREHRSKRNVKLKTETDKAFSLFISFASFTVIAILISLTICGMALNNGSAKKDLASVRNAINDTYDVNISYADAESFIRTETKILNLSDMNEKSKDWTAIEEYGTQNLLMEDGEIVEAQLIRVRQEFILVYAEENGEPQKFRELSRR